MISIFRYWTKLSYFGIPTNNIQNAHVRENCVPSRYDLKFLQDLLLNIFQDSHFWSALHYMVFLPSLEERKGKKVKVM